MGKKKPAKDMRILTYDNAGKGLAFLGMLIFILNIVFFLLSRAQPQQFYLFAGTGHMIVMSIIALIFVAFGYFLTKVRSRPAE